MSFYKLTVEQAELGKAGANFHDRAFPATAPLAAAWSSLFGQLHQCYVLQHLSATAIPDSLCFDALPSGVEARQSHVLRADIRPFEPALGGAHPLHELRRYDLRPQAQDEFSARMRDILDLRERLSPCLGAWTTAAGTAGQVWHIWSYESLQQRDAVRDELIRNPTWNAYSSSVVPLIQRQVSILLKPLA